MEDNEFGDFAGFSSTSSGEGNLGKTAMEQDSQKLLSRDKVTGNGFPNFSSFDQLDFSSDKFCVAGGFPFEIPSLPSSPISGEDNNNVHMAGGMPIEIPPLPDFSSLDVPLGDLELPGDSNVVPLSLTMDDSESTQTFQGVSNSSILVSEPVQGSQSSVVGHTWSSAAVSLPPHTADEFGRFSVFTTATSEFGGGLLPPELDKDFTFGNFSSGETGSGDGLGKVLATTSASIGTTLTESATNGLRTSTMPSDSGNEVGNSSANTWAVSMPSEPFTSKFLDLKAEGSSEFGGFAPVVDSSVGLKDDGRHENCSNPAGDESLQDSKSDDFSAFGAFTGGSVEAVSSSDVPARIPEDSLASKASNSTSAIATARIAGSGDFGNFSGSLVATGLGVGNFADLSGITAGTKESEGDDDFGNFGSFSSISATTNRNNDFGNFGKFSDNTGAASAAATKASSTSDEFGNFGSFSGPSTTGTRDGDVDDEFGGFGGFSGTATTGTIEKTEFGDFGTFVGTGSTSAEGRTAKNNFGDFGGFSNSLGSGKAVASDDFGDFEGVSNSSAAAKSTASETTTFGAFSGLAKTDAKVDEGFGEFGSFSSVSTAPSGPSTVTSSNSFGTSQSSEHVGKMLRMCFEDGGRTTAAAEEQPSSLLCLIQVLQSRHNGEQTQTFKSVWLSLQGCIDLTVPLHKFDSSCLQGNYYTSLSVDPKLETRPTTLSVLSGMAKFEDPLGGTTAVEDLRESFGFEGDLPELGSPTEKNAGGFRRVSVDNAPALLDLSLPLSPKQKEEASFILAADLADLDLNPQSKQQKAKQLTSIEELLINERLVVNRSTWVDSQLADLGGNSGTSGHDDDRCSSQPDTPHTAAKKTVELQLRELGLDVSKTTLPKAKPGELSLSARTLLGRLPDLSFMQLPDKIEDRTNYARGYS